MLPVDSCHYRLLLLFCIGGTSDLFLLYESDYLQDYTPCYPLHHSIFEALAAEFVMNHDANTSGIAYMNEGVAWEMRAFDEPWRFPK